MIKQKYDCKTTHSHCVSTFLRYVGISSKLVLFILGPFPFLNFSVFTFGCPGFLFLREHCLQLRRAGSTLSLWCMDLSLWWLRLLRSTRCRVGGCPKVAAHGLNGCGSRALEHGHSCLEARGIFLNQGLTLCPLHWLTGS